ncbi:MAG: hypothetical protein M3483_05500 [Gemmatimonadota bacterium]|nr:hypothetical protein [Gemmatimonadota bacterium]
MTTQDVLIVSAATGTGHMRAAEALRGALALRDPGQVAEHVDLLELAPRWVRAAYGDGYELMATRAPRLWREVYRRTDALDADRARWGPIAQRILFREFRRLLLSRRWSVCVCTHFLPGQLAASGPGFPPFALVITDLTLHHYWAQPRVQRYFVATEALADEVRHRVPGAQIQATGIPIAPKFAAAPSRAEARRALGLDRSRPVALVMGGGLGLGVAEGVEAAVGAQVDGIQIVAVCGRNHAAAGRLRGAGLPEDRLRVLDYSDRVEQLIAAADIVVTKPGGLTTSEALALGRPLLLTRPIPGQEEGNTRVLTASGSALAAADPAALRHMLEHAFNEPGVLAQLAASARRCGRPYAAQNIAGAIRRDYVLDIAA